MVKSIGVLRNAFLQCEELKINSFLGHFPIHYAALLINRTVNNNYMTLLMALHHTNDELLDASRVTLIPGTLPTFNLPKKSHPSSGKQRFR